MGRSEVMLFRDGQGWGVTLALPRGEVRRYRYRCEAQARFFAAVLSLGPRVLPSGAEVVTPPRPRRRRRSRPVAPVTP